MVASGDEWGAVGAEPIAGSFKILLVDDSPFVRNQVKEILSGQPVVLLEAGDGVEALDIVAKHTDIKLILCDINMPRMDGLAFIERLGANEPNKKPRMPIVMLTTENKLDMVMKGKKLGASAWIIKPPAPRDIMMLVEKFKTT